MKSIKIYLFPLFLIMLFSAQVSAQDDFYSNKKSNEISSEQTVLKTDSILVHGYFTEKDYNKIYKVKEHQNISDSEIYYEDEIYQDEEHEKKEKDNFWGEVAAEVIVEVVVSTLFIIAEFWH